MNNSNSRKRPLESAADGVITNKENNGIGSRASQAQDLKRRQIQQANWGLKEALAECGLVEFAPSDNSSGDSSNNGKNNNNMIGCQMDASTSPSTLRSSINALLEEMSRNGIDTNNERVLADLTEIIANNDNNILRKMLLPLYRVRNCNNQNLFSQFSQPEEEEEENGGNSDNEIIVESSSLVKILLRVDALQSTLLTALIQKLPELASAYDDDNNNGSINHDDVPRLIFQNIRWLDHIMDTSALTMTFVECLTVLASSSSSCEKTRQILLDAVATLPDILNTNGEEEQSSILSTLQHLRMEDPSLLIPCLDAVGSLALTELQLEDATRDALEALANVERWGLPALTTFIFQQGSSNNSDLAKEVIDEIRKLPLGKSSYDSDDIMDTTSPNNNGSNTESLMIESLSRGFAHRSDLASQLLKSIKETSMGEHLPADIWLLACAASASHHRSKVKSIFRTKANSGGFTSQLLRQSLCGNGTALNTLFNTSLLELADGLLRSPDNAAIELGVTLYEVLFETFEEPIQRTDVVHSLVSHVCSGVGVKDAEVDAAMRAFTHIIDKGDGARKLRTFTPFLSSMLDHLHQMSTSQVRRLFLLLFAAGSDDDGRGHDDEMISGGLGVGGSSAMGSACDDVQIVIEKNLSHVQLSNKRIGIIGTVAYAVTRSAQLLKQQEFMEAEETDTTCLPAGTASASSPIVKDITEKIEKAYSKCQPVGTMSSIDTNLTDGNMVTTSSHSSGSAAAFMLDELCHAVQGGRLAQEIRDWLDEKFCQEFEDTFVGDFEEMEEGQKGSKGAKDDGLDPHQIPSDQHDLALLNGTATNCIQLPGEMRFRVEGNDSHVYVKILPFLTSLNRSKREMLIQQLCPMFRLMASLSDERYGGRGLSEIDAMLESPFLMPSAESSGMEFEDLPAIQQWVVTSTYFYATCWVRELINSFIYTTDPSTSEVIATSSSQGSEYEEAQKKVVDRLKALLDLEEELRFTSSKCFVFSPPGLDTLAAPKELFEVHSPNIEIPDVDPHASKAEKKAATEQKKKMIKRAKEKEKSKTKILKVKKKHEELLSSRALGALRPLDPQVCCAIGFAELGVMKDSNGEGSQCLSQVEVPACSGPVITLLLNLLDKSLTDILSAKKSLPFKSGNEERNDDNPYQFTSQSVSSNASVDAFVSHEDSLKNCLQLLESYLKSGVFASLHEHMAVVAELRCGQNSSDNDTDTEKKLVATARCLFSCLRTMFESEILTRSPSGKIYLYLILKQLARGDRGAIRDGSVRRPSSAHMNKLLNLVVDNVSEIITGAYTGDLEFAMDGVKTIQSIFECSQRVSDSSFEAEAETIDFGTRLSKVSEKLLKEHWPDDTKMNKSNVGKLLALFLEHAPNRMESLTLLVNEVLLELPHTEKCKGPVTTFPTCTSQSFGSYYSVVMGYLWKELVKLFDCDTKNPAVAKNLMDSMSELINLLQSLFNLTKKNECLAKKAILLQQLKCGSKFIEIFVSKALPFFQVHFEQYQDAIFELIRRMQKNCRQMYAIIAHGKREKDVNLAKETPRAKKVLEIFIHKVKSLLKKNRCMTAMWTKTLKATDLDGSALSEEGTSQSESEDSGEEEDVSVKEEKNVDDESESENEFSDEDD